MFQIRNNVWETNSSSTHSLSMKKTELYTPLSWRSMDVFQREYIIEPIEYPSPTYATYTTIEQKLAYFYTLYKMVDHNYNWLMKKLKQLFPNAKFVENFTDNWYVFEDGDCWPDEEFFKNITLDELAIFMLYGVIKFGNRDDEEFMDKIYKLHKDPDTWGCYWCG